MLTKIKRILQSTFFYKIYLLIVKNYRFWVIDHNYPCIYKRASRKPVNQNKVVFIETRHSYLTNSFTYMYDTLKKKPGIEISCQFMLQATASKKEQRKICRQIMKNIGDAKCVFLNDATDAFSRVKIRPETTVVQLWHGCGAFKKFGLSTADLLFGATREYMELHSFHSNYSFVTVSSPEVMWAYEEAMGYTRESGVVRPLGISRTDVFFDKEYIKAAKNKVCEKINAAETKKIILYAPTFRGQITSATAPDVLDFEQLKSALGEEYIFLVKHHPLVKKRPAIPSSCSDFAFDVTTELSIEDLICTADICISDYSSLVFEYSLFEKPMLFLAYDLDEYFDWRGFYYDYFEFSPGPIVKSTEEVIDYILNIRDKFDKQRVIDFKNKFMSACDGNATQRIIKEIFG